jgi:hypothetical protein
LLDIFLISRTFLTLASATYPKVSMCTAQRRKEKSACWSASSYLYIVSKLAFLGQCTGDVTVGYDASIEGQRSALHVFAGGWCRAGKQVSRSEELVELVVREPSVEEEFPTFRQRAGSLPGGHTRKYRPRTFSQVVN